jgi:HEAT repeat protein
MSRRSELRFGLLTQVGPAPVARYSKAPPRVRGSAPVFQTTDKYFQNSMPRTITFPGLADLSSDDAEKRRLTLAILDEEFAIRRLAIAALAEMNDVTAIPALLDIAADPDPDLSSAARSALLEFRTRDAVDPFIAGVTHSSPAAREAALAGLRELKSPRAIPALRVALEDSAPAVRREAILTLARVPDQGVKAMLLPALQDSDVNVRRTAVAAVASLRAPEVLAYLLRSLRDMDWTVRRDAAALLAGFPFPGAVAGLQRALRDEYAQVVREAISSLGRIRAPVSAAIAPFLDHPVAELRIATMKALGGIGDPAFRIHVSRMLTDPSPDVIAVALNLLERPVEPRFEAA